MLGQIDHMRQMIILLSRAGSKVVCLDLVFADQLPKSPPVFLGSLGGLGNIPLVYAQEILNIRSFKL